MSSSPLIIPSRLFGERRAGPASGTLRASVVVITKDEAERLDLVLASLAGQVRAAGPDGDAWEVIVVDDGSSDGTKAVLAAWSHRLALRTIRHHCSQGRSNSRNAGAKVARGEILIFLDGDVLAGPRLVERHLALHDRSPGALGRGETWHLRCTRFLRDPRTGAAMPGQEERVLRLGSALSACLVTVDQVLERFDEIARRGEPGIYPGAGPRHLFELEMAALRRGQPLDVAWMAASGHNFSVPRAAFLASGGYHPSLTINEHRELALRLSSRGARVVLVEDARSYHLTHRSGWRDPLEDTEWEKIFYACHPCPAVALMSIFWLSISGDPYIPEAARLHTLEELDRAARGESPVDYAAIRLGHPRLGALDLLTPLAAGISS